MTKLTDEQLKMFIKEKFIYDCESGIVRWKEIPKYGRPNSGILGTKSISHKITYLKANLFGRSVFVHRIAWFLYYNEWPVLNIDHIDGNGLNNRINNLRHVTTRENQNNRIIHRNGRLVGCSYHKLAKKWMARIRCGQQRIHLGLFNTEQEAHERYLQARKEIEE